MSFTPASWAAGPHSRRAVLAGIGASGLSACAATPRLSPAFATPQLIPIRLEPERITRITVCTRPFRAAGPRLDVEQVAGKRVVHNYGHGGSGWSLSWGSAAIATANALQGGTRDVAVIGCGAIGLTTAVTLMRAGARVTVYAAERTMQTRSARATGSWTPDSRIAAVDGAAPGFAELWEKMARAAWPQHHAYVGIAGDAVSFSDRYSLFDGAAAIGARRPGRFAEYGERLEDLVPPFRDVPAATTPFRVARVRAGTSMQFNVAEYAHLLLQEMLQGGGRIVQRRFDSPADLAGLAEPVVVNCTGYGARALWRDESIVPVRGQIAWLAPQPDVHYGVNYNHVSVLPRADGVVVQYTGEGEDWGYGVTDETPDRGEAMRAVAAVAPIFRRG